MYFVTSEPGEDADMALNSMFKFMAAQENDTVREKIIRWVGTRHFMPDEVLSNKKNKVSWDC